MPDKISYANKIAKTDPPIPEINKFTADNANEIKESVNGLYDLLPFQLSPVLQGGNYVLSDNLLKGKNIVQISGGGATFTLETDFTKDKDAIYIGSPAPNENVLLPFTQGIKYTLTPGL